MLPKLRLRLGPNQFKTLASELSMSISIPAVIPEIK
jgi:hypothetical protein